jgi:hypothetical protein
MDSDSKVPRKHSSRPKEYVQTQQSLSEESMLKIFASNDVAGTAPKLVNNLLAKVPRTYR